MSLFLALVLCLSLMPVGATADEDASGEPELVEEAEELVELGEHAETEQSEEAAGIDPSEDEPEEIEEAEPEAAEEAAEIVEEALTAEDELGIGLDGYGLEIIESKPYIEVNFSQTSYVGQGIVRYISQLTSSEYFYSDYWGKWKSQAIIECGTACISMSLSYLGINKTPYDILEKNNGKTYFTGWGATHLTPALATAIDNYVNGQGLYSPPIIHLPSYSANGHYVIIIGQISSTQFHVLNPASNEIGIMTISGTTWSYLGKSGSIDEVHQYKGSSSDTPATSSSITLSGHNYPTSITAGQSFSLTGTISSGLTLTDVTVAVYNSSGTKVLGKTVSPNSTSYNIKNIDSYIKFGTLSAGTYYYRISAENSSVSMLLLNQQFSVTAASTPTPTPTPTPASTSPAKPAAPTVRAYNESVIVSWHDVDGETGYDVYLVQSPWRWADIKYSAHVSANITNYAFTNVASGYYQAFVVSRPNDDQTQSPWTGFTKYYVTFDANGGLIYDTQSVSSRFVLSGNTIGALPIGKRDNYIFDGWYTEKMGGTRVTTDMVITADTVVYAHWADYQYVLSINGMLDCQKNDETIDGCGTLDVYINGSLAANDVTRYCEPLPYGTAYEIRDIRPTAGKSFDGIGSGSRAGTIGGNTEVTLNFSTIPASITETPVTAYYNGHIYQYFSTPVTWYAAKQLCENMGGHLATITNAEENAFVSGLFQTNAWIGMTDDASEGIWRWVTDEIFSYTKWFDGEPYNGTSNDEGAENYGCIYANGQWDDAFGYYRLGFVCEKDGAPATYTVTYNANGGSVLTETALSALPPDARIVLDSRITDFSESVSAYLHDIDVLYVTPYELNADNDYSGVVKNLEEKISADRTHPEIRLIGDVNGDGIFDTRDVLEIVEYILDQEGTGGAAAGDETVRRDINFDGVVDVLDLTCLVRFITGTNKGFVDA